VSIGASVYYWPGAYFGFGLGFGYWSDFDWLHRTIIINIRHRPRFVRHDYDWKSHRGAWHHEPRHRRGVSYRDRPTAERFGQFRERHQGFNRETRGFPVPERAGRPQVKRGQEQRIRGPVTASGGWAGKPNPGTGHPGPPERQRNEGVKNPAPSPGFGNRTRNERGGYVGARPSAGSSPEVARVPAAPPAPARSAPPSMERVEPRPQPSREMSRPSENRWQGERTTIFSGGNGREENRSSFRGRESRGSRGSGESEQRSFGRGENDNGGRSRYRH